MANRAKNFSSDVHGPEDPVSEGLQQFGATTWLESRERGGSRWHRLLWRALGESYVQQWTSFEWYDDVDALFIDFYKLATQICYKCRHPAPRAADRGTFHSSYSPRKLRHIFVLLRSTAHRISNKTAYKNRLYIVKIKVILPQSRSGILCVRLATSLWRCDQFTGDIIHLVWSACLEDRRKLICSDRSM